MYRIANFWIFRIKFEGMDENHMSAMIKNYDHDGDDQMNYVEFCDFYSKVKAK